VLCDAAVVFVALYHAASACRLQLVLRCPVTASR
jgi:hypothetical protein